ncbi:hypothetical protein K4A83_12250 [Spirulina subsalsa FACHB-351]|uniref:SHOCT domain-containing protein n=1 Tax=Spirulina subsalsa FACHB-351 TaxID=234711 RepID=A0ABT3L773_9CYAN|nr:hypothetical protein [Spirulina subsalsa]MCW6037032.1 hypothetical protein [Spirulina subsalsa FACHB-351]
MTNSNSKQVSRVFTATPLGALIVFVLLSIFVGGVNNAVVVIFFSVICTFGISLALWLPVCFAVGLICLMVVESVSSQWSRTREEVAAGPTPQQKALRNYIRQARHKGLSESQIDRRLGAKGWTEEEIEMGRELLLVTTEGN